MNTAAQRFQPAEPLVSAEALLKTIGDAGEKGAADLIARSSAPLRARFPGQGLTVLHPGPVASQAIGQAAARLYGAPGISGQARAGLDMDFRAAFRGLAWRCNLTACAPHDLAMRELDPKLANARPADLCLTLRRLGLRPPGLEQLGVGQPGSAPLEAWLPKDGLVLVSGIPGSGKSTVLARVLLERAAARPELILTYEAPVELDLQDESHAGSIIQTDLPRDLRDPQADLGASDAHYAYAMRNVVRRAADAVFLGETRDREAALALLDAARLGLAAYTTIHAVDAHLSPMRLLGMLPANEREAATAALRSGLRLLVHAYRSEGRFRRRVIRPTAKAMAGPWDTWSDALKPLAREEDCPPPATAPSGARSPGENQ